MSINNEFKFISRDCIVTDCTVITNNGTDYNDAQVNMKENLVRKFYPGICFHDFHEEKFKDSSFFRSYMQFAFCFVLL
jgi:hypothetical protein